MDKYDDEIVKLTEDPSLIVQHWSDATPLFNFAGNVDTCPDEEWRRVNCLTAIRSNPGAWRAQTPELTAAILADERIPKSHTDIKLEHLPVFAEWQRRIDKELCRE